MASKDFKIGRMNGRYFVLTEKGYQPLGDLQEVEITEETPELDPPGVNRPRMVCPSESKLQVTLTVTVADEQIRRLVAIERLWSAVYRAATLYASYPGGKVKHLALYAKKRRTRKKNMRRIRKELLKRNYGGNK